MTIIYERLDKGICPLCGTENWLYRDGTTETVACGTCTRKLFLSGIRDTRKIRKTPTVKRLKKLH
jgi:hypothetical protein